jgi:hypothetical protein
VCGVNIPERRRTQVTKESSFAEAILSSLQFDLLVL